MAKQAQKPNQTTQEDAGTTAANSGAPAVQFIAIPNAEPETFAVTLTRQAMVNGKIRKAGSSVRVNAELLEELEAAGLIA